MYSKKQTDIWIDRLRNLDNACTTVAKCLPTICSTFDKQNSQYFHNISRIYLKYLHNTVCTIFTEYLDNITILFRNISEIFHI